MDASHDCRSKGYALVTINDATEEAFLHNEENARHSGTWWIGLNDRHIEGAMVWIGDPSGHVNWTPGEPNDQFNNEDCVEDNFSSDGRWNDSICSLPRPYICERGASGLSYFNVTNTSSAQQNTHDRVLYLEGGRTVKIGTCGLPGASFSGDTYVRIVNASGAEIASNDNACGGLGSQLTFTAPSAGFFTLRTGCLGSGACSGAVAHQLQ